MLYEPGFELGKYFLIISVLMLVGLLPYVDNYARLGGILFGTFFSFIHIHYIPPWDGLKEFKSFKDYVHSLSKRRRVSIKQKGCDYICMKLNRYNLKIAFLVTGFISIVLLYVIFFVWFFEFQRTWTGFVYLNCVIPTKFSDLCQDFAQEIRPRASSVAN